MTEDNQRDIARQRDETIRRMINTLGLFCEDIEYFNAEYFNETGRVIWRVDKK